MATIADSRRRLKEDFGQRHKIFSVYFTPQDGGTPPARYQNHVADGCASRPAPENADPRNIRC